LLAPVMSFTAEEAWQHLPGRTSQSVFLAGFPEPTGAMAPGLAERYAKLFAVRGAVQGVLEVARRDKRIGASLEARVALTAEGLVKELLQAHLLELPGLFIVSQVEWADTASDAATALDVSQAFGDGASLAVEVLPAKGTKCPRCWVYSEGVEAGGGVCPKCREALG
ncbi:MAG: isoleucine--tRNA ligase, partial [Myxococcaceae bacterium]